VNVDLLQTAFPRLKQDAVPGADPTTWREYKMEATATLHARVHRETHRRYPS